MKGVKCKYCTTYKDNKHTIYCHLQKCEIPSYKCDKNNCKFCTFEPEVYVVLGVGRCDLCPCVMTAPTPGVGCATDYYCKAANCKKIVGYVEWDSEIPPVPDWCPFRKIGD